MDLDNILFLNETSSLLLFSLTINGIIHKVTFDMVLTTCERKNRVFMKSRGLKPRVDDFKNENQMRTEILKMSRNETI